MLGAYQALERQVHAGKVEMLPYTEMLDLVVVDGRARGIVTRNLVTGKIESHVADAVVLATGGYGNVYYLSTNAKGSNSTAIWRAYKRGAAFANPCFTQIHPTCIPVSGDYQSKLTLMSESLRNDGRIWVPKKGGDKRSPDQIPEAIATIIWSGGIRASAIWCLAMWLRVTPRWSAMKGAAWAGRAGGLSRLCGIRSSGLGKHAIAERYGNLFDMYKRITGEDPYRGPDAHLSRRSTTRWAGLWVDYELMSTIPGLFVLGEANFSDHGANRLGASALMQGLSDGYFIAPYTIGNYLASNKLEKVDAYASGVSGGGSGVTR